MNSAAELLAIGRRIALWAMFVVSATYVASAQKGAEGDSRAGLKSPKVAACLTDCTPRFGIVSAFGNEAELLVTQTVDRHQYHINGNVFTTGMLEGNPVVIVLTGQSIENASMLTQLLIDHFSINHLLLSGIAGGVSDANHIGDVVVPEKWALPLEGYWNGSSELPAPCGKAGDLSCVGEKLSTFTSAPNSDYHVRTSDAPVGTGLFMRDTFVMTASNAPQGEFKFDYAVDPEMLRIARTIKPELDRCGPKNRSLCVSSQPHLVVGGRGVTLSTFLANSNYREYLSQTLGGVSVDMETGAFAHVAYANGIPFLTFRALSDQAGGSDYKEVGAFFGSGLAEANESRVTLAFLQAWSKAHPNHMPHSSH
jgi:adenosylhomocysteine nucleosidase